MYPQATPLNVPWDRIDESTLNNQLFAPNVQNYGNDVWPQLNFPPGMDQGLLTYAIAAFRKTIQDRLQKGPVQVVVYNLFSQNHFRNQFFTEYCQKVVHFVQYLVAAQREQPQQAVSKACEYIYKGALAAVVFQYQNEIVQLVPQHQQHEFMNSVQQSAKLLQDIDRDVMQFMSQPANPGYGGWNQQPGGYGQQPGGYGQMGPVSMMGNPSMGGGSPMSNLSRYAPAAPGHSPPQMGPDQGQGPQVTSTSRTSIIEPFSSKKPPAQDFPTMDTTPQNNVQEQADFKNAILDPFAYVPPGVQIDKSRPYDVVYVPGGKIVPLCLYDRDVKLPSFPEHYDSQKYIPLVGIHNDGSIEIFLRAYMDEFDYLRHETNEQLRAIAFDPKGKVIPNEMKVVESGEQPAENEGDKVEISLKDNNRPVVLEEAITAISDLDAEESAARDVRDMLHLNDDDPIPAHEYIVRKTHPLQISTEAQHTLEGVVQTFDYVEVADGLRSALNRGIISMRVFRFLDQHLTHAINTTLSDNLGLVGYSIDSFTQDIKELLDVILESEGSKYHTSLQFRAIEFFKKWMTTTSSSIDDNGIMRESYALIEEDVRLQSSWKTEEIATLEMNNGPAVVSERTHPAMHKVFKRLIDTYSDGDNEGFKPRIKVISIDGTYFELVVGWLSQKAILIKRL